MRASPASPLSCSLQLLCHIADLELKGMLPGTLHQQVCACSKPPGMLLHCEGCVSGSQQQQQQTERGGQRQQHLPKSIMSSTIWVSPLRGRFVAVLPHHSNSHTPCLLQAALLCFIHSSIEPSLPHMSPLHLATMLWAYAAVGIATHWTDALLQQVGCGWVWRRMLVGEDGVCRRAVWVLPGS